MSIESWRYRLRLVGTDKRERQKVGRSTRLDAAREEAAKAANRRRYITIGAIVAVVVALVVITTVLGGDDDQKVSSDGTTTTTAAVGSTTSGDGSALQAATLTGPGAGKELSGKTPCPEADGSSERTTGFTEAPPMCIDDSKTYKATFETTKGTMVVDLDAKTAPKTVNNFVVLARYHFFDGSPFFRLVKDFAAQFGDPSESPSNSAQFGYTIPDELPAEGSYKVGSLAMANTGSPDSGGAQMFFITGPNGVSLPPSYSLFGQVTEGLDVLQKINEVPSVQTDTNDGAPTEQVTIDKVTIEES
jgi:cyclophilin family peptidyl-prolyl cis-trans isomerase